MSLTQEQAIAIVKAGRTIYDLIQVQIEAFDDLVKYKLDPTLDRLAKLNPSEDIQKQFDSLYGDIKELRASYNQLLYKVTNQYVTIRHWEDHYKQRYNSNIASRRWRQRRQNLPTEQQVTPMPELEPNEDDEAKKIKAHESLLQELLKKDEWEPYPGRKPAHTNNNDWNDFVQYITIGIRWHEIKNKTWTTVGFQYGNNILTETFDEATKDMELNLGQPIDLGQP